MSLSSFGQVREEGKTRKKSSEKYIFRKRYSSFVYQMCVYQLVQRRGRLMIRIALINFDRSNLNGALGTKACRGEFKRVRGVVLGNTSRVSNSFDTFCLKGRKEMPCWVAYILLMFFFFFNKNEDSFTYSLKKLQVQRNAPEVVSVLNR